MKRILNIIFYIGFLFFGGGFMIAFCQFIAYNGLGNVFEYEKAEDAKIHQEAGFLNKIEIVTIHYSYTLNNQTYNATESIAISAIKKANMQIDEVFYNRTFPSLSYVGNNKLKLTQAKVGMLVMGAFLIFLGLIFIFIDKDKWIGVYTRGEYKSSKR